MKRISVIESKTAVRQALSAYQTAIAEAKAVKIISRSDIAAAVEDLRGRLSETDLRKLSPEQLEKRAVGTLQNLAITRLRSVVLKKVSGAETALQTLLATVAKVARRLMQPDIPEPAKAGHPYEETLLDMAIVREMRAVRQEHQVDRLERRFSRMTPQQRLAELESAQANGDALSAYVLDYMLLDELPQMKVEGGSGDAIMRQHAEIDGLRRRFTELEDARFTEDETKLLNEWRGEAETATRDWARERHLLVAIIQRGTVDLEDLAAERAPAHPSIEAFRREAAFAVGNLQLRLVNGDQDAAAAMKRIGITTDDWKTLPADEKYGVIEKALVTAPLSHIDERREVALKLFGRDSGIVKPKLDELAAALVA